MARRKGAVQKISERSGAFAVMFLFLFAVTFGFLALVGATPNPPSGAGSSIPASSDVQATTTNAVGQYPVRVVAKDIGLDINVINPTSTNVDDLDNDLTQGTVRYPTSGLLGVNGTVLIFGHSSYLPVIYHQYYKEFDGIQNLKSGEIVSVYSSDTEYRFAVTGIRVADANNTSSDVIELPNDAQYLTLITCDSFATQSNRFIVTAKFVGAYKLAQPALDKLRFLYIILPD